MLNFGLSPDFSVQLKVSLSESLSRKLKSPIVPVYLTCLASEHCFSWASTPY